jgi:hypothetical protein
MNAAHSAAFSYSTRAWLAQRRARLEPLPGRALRPLLS